MVNVNLSKHKSYLNDVSMGQRDIFYTIYESELGKPLLDIYYFDSLTKLQKIKKLFICPRIQLFKS